MSSDEREIRTVHSLWINAVNAGDLARLLTLVAEDVVFLTPGQARPLLPCQTAEGGCSMLSGH